MTGSNWGKYYFEYHDSLSEDFYCKYLPEEDFIYYAIDFKISKKLLKMIIIIIIMKIQDLTLMMMNLVDVNI